MNFEYAKDSKEQRPYEHYLNAYREMDPKEISGRTGIPYDEEKGLFTVKLMGSTYQVSFPDYEIHHVEDSIGVYPLEDAMNAKILIVRFLTERSAAPASGKLLTYHDVPWGEVYFRQFQGRCRFGWHLAMEISFLCSVRLWNIWEQKNVQRETVPINWNLWTICM